MTLLTIDEAARFLRLTKRTLYQRLRHSTGALWASGDVY